MILCSFPSTLAFCADRLPLNQSQEDVSPLMGRIIVGLQSAARQERIAAQVAHQAKIDARLAVAPARFSFFGERHNRIEQAKQLESKRAETRQILEDEELEWREERKKQPVGKEEGLRAAEEALEAAGWDPNTNLGQNMVSLRLGWAAYDGDTPRRVIILDQWRQWAVWERKCRAIVAKMKAMQQILTVSNYFFWWHRAVTAAQQKEAAQAAQAAPAVQLTTIAPEPPKQAKKGGFRRLFGGAKANSAVSAFKGS
eukprot:COSAG05_NODE_2219_length_3375_cov_231.829879_4_plen_255_part_00